MKKILTILIMELCLFSVQAQKDNTLLKSIIQDKGQAQITFFENSKTQLKQISKHISIDAYHDGKVTAYLSSKQIDSFLLFHYDYKIISENKSTQSLNVATTIEDMSTWDKYPSYEVYMEMMQNFAINYPDICQLDTIGKSQEGHFIVVLEISKHINIDENEPEFLYSGQMHGDELVDGLLFLRLIDYLLKNYSSDVEITELIDNVEIWINPIANPDGMYYGGNDNVSDAIRYLSNGIDPNRNFPNPEEGKHPDGQNWAKETQDMMHFCESHDFVMSANSHSGAEVINYPWDSWENDEVTTADLDWWLLVSKEYADLAQSNSPSNYFTDVESSGYVNGGDWYIVYGSRQDYMNYYRHCRELTLELSSDKKLNSDLLPDYWNYNKEAFLRYLKQVRYGINGIVTDACTGTAIKAKIEIESHDTDNSFVYSSLPIGNFHRPIYKGTYNIIVSAEGYKTQIIENISVDNYSSNSLNIILEPITTASFTYNKNLAEVSFSNTSVNTTEDYTWDFGDNTYSTEKHPTHTYTSNGNYLVTLTANGSCKSDTYNESIQISGLNIDYKETFSVYIYPNPCQDKLQFEIQNKISKQDATIEIVDISGKIVLKYQTYKTHFTIPIKHLQKGSYLVRISNIQDGRIIKKIIKI